MRRPRGHGPRTPESGILRRSREAVNLDEDILLAPEERNSRQPILLLDRLVSERPVCGRKYARFGGKIWTDDLASDSASSDSHVGVVPDALVFPRVAARHHIELFALFSKPDRRRYSCAALAKGGQADVFLAFNFWRDRHGDIVRDESTERSPRRQKRSSCSVSETSRRRPQRGSALSGLVRL
jgi:hypothetical protein